MNGLKQTLSIKRALLLFLIVGVICPVVVFALWISHRMGESMQQSEDTFARQTVQNNAQLLENAIASISYAAIYITGDGGMRENAAAVNSDPGSPEASFAKEHMIKYMRWISSAVLYSLDPELSMIFPSGYVLNGEYGLWLDQPQVLFSQFEDGKNSLWYNPCAAPGTDLDSYWAVRQFGELVGLLHIHIPGEALWEQLTNHPMLQEQQEIYNYDTLICAKSPGLSYEAGETTAYTQSLRRWGMTLRVTVPNQLVTAKANEQRSMFFWYFLILIILLLVCILVISDHMSLSIREIVGRMRKIQQGDLTPQPPSGSYEEISLLADNLNEVAIRINALTDEAAQQARLKEQMYYEALMAQINPHFLYNTLNSIKWLAAINGNDTVANMLSRLGGALHYTFGHSSDQVTVQQELAFLDDYVALLQLRFGNAAQFTADVPQTLLEDQIPRFCIQPIVENALTHGGLSLRDGAVALRIEIQDGDMIITVSDNGVGMEQERAERLLHEPHPSGSFTGIGVWNVHQRIRLLFGEPYGLSITSSPNQGCTVEIKLPRR